MEDLKEGNVADCETNKPRITAEQAMDIIIADTITRYTELDEKEYLEKLGIKNTEGLNENDAVNFSMFNIMMELMREVLIMNKNAEALNCLFKMIIENKKD